MPFTFHFLHSITGFAHYPIPTLDDVTFAKRFVDSIFGTIENVKNGDGMRCLRNVNDIKNNILSTIVLRSITEPFWKSCIEVTERGQRVCAVGSPGIGKSVNVSYFDPNVIGEKKDCGIFEADRKPAELVLPVLSKFRI